ncbi:MAG: maleylacetoacetate isomerase [Geminicoccaceae bacterium]|nr:maleylacetoacetate isomerase [Geminicoccaceae bacterium]
MRLYDYWRSSAAYRVRIALNLKGIAYQQVSVDLRAKAQQEGAYLEKNPQGLVPLLEDGEVRLAQSLAIIDYLDDVHPEPALLPDEPKERARARSLALLIACDIHPLNNLRVLTYLERELGVDEDRRLAWYRHWIALGLGALERELIDHKAAFALGERPTLVDVCLVPQMANARRYRCDLEPYPTLRVIDEHCQTIPAIAAAAPDRQPDAVG